VFKFKGSKKSNNGTDVNAGQIPQLLYRLPSRDNTTVTRKSDTTESALILSQDFSCSVSPVNFLSHFLYHQKVFCPTLLPGITVSHCMSGVNLLSYSVSSVSLLSCFISPVSLFPQCLYQLKFSSPTLYYPKSRVPL
jgi:hypothetical protein